MENKNEVIHTIKKIQHIEDYNSINNDFKLLMSGSAFVAGALGLCTFYKSYVNGSVSTGDLIMTPISAIPLILALSIYLKKRISANIAIKKIREETGLTKEKQKEILEESVEDGNTIAIELYNYFYDAEKRKTL